MVFLPLPLTPSLQLSSTLIFLWNIGEQDVPFCTFTSYYYHKIINYLCRFLLLKIIKLRTMVTTYLLSCLSHMYTIYYTSPIRLWHS